jgi:hypothetical protein
MATKAGARLKPVRRSIFPHRHKDTLEEVRQLI